MQMPPVARRSALEATPAHDVALLPSSHVVDEATLGRRRRTPRNDGGGPGPWGATSASSNTDEEDSVEEHEPRSTGSGSTTSSTLPRLSRAA